jgi:hypothetical protein
LEQETEDLYFELPRNETSPALALSKDAMPLKCSVPDLPSNSDLGKSPINVSKGILKSIKPTWSYLVV